MYDRNMWKVCINQTLNSNLRFTTIYHFNSKLRNLKVQKKVSRENDI